MNTVILIIGFGFILFQLDRIINHLNQIGK